MLETQRSRGTILTEIIYVLCVLVILFGLAAIVVIFSGYDLQEKILPSLATATKAKIVLLFFLAFFAIPFILIAGIAGLLLKSNDGTQEPQQSNTAEVTAMGNEPTPRKNQKDEGG